MSHSAPLKPRDLFDLLLLAAVWGGSFLFMRIAAPVIGPVAIAAARVAVACIVLTPMVWWRGDLPAMRPLIGTLLVSGLLSSVLPFIALSSASQGVPAGMMSILNATTPLWGALVGWCWAGEALGLRKALGLGLGLLGVALLTFHRGALQGEVAHSAVALSLAATLMYALGVHHARKHLASLPPLSVTAGSMGMGAVVLAWPALWLGPQPVAAHADVHQWADVPMGVWAAMSALALVCTAWAYLLFYRLIARIGPSRSMSVTFLVPVFGVLWGALFLGEQVSLSMVGSAGVIVLGTWLSNQPLKWPFSWPRTARG